MRALPSGGGQTSAYIGPMSLTADPRDALRAQLPLLRDRFGVRRLRLLGSHGRRTAGPDSDVDLLVEFASPPDLFAFVALREHLCEALGRPVDLVTPEALDARLAEGVLHEAEPL